MAWTLILDFVYTLDVVGLALILTKTGIGAACGFFLKKIWEIFMHGEDNVAKCCIPECRNFRTLGTKGLCMKCYKSAKKKVDSGEISWERLSELGLCEEVGKDVFNEALDNALRNSN